MKTVVVRNIKIGEGMPKICVPILGKNREEILGFAEKVKEANVDLMSEEVEAVLVANAEIVDSIATLSASSDEVSSETQSCKATISGAYNDIGMFSDKVEGTFVQLQELAAATQE